MKLGSKKTASKASKQKASARHDWHAFDSLTDEEVSQAARSDPDAQPLSDAQLARMKRPNPKVVRRVRAGPVARAVR
jgi:hypothetical protein